MVDNPEEVNLLTLQFYNFDLAINEFLVSSLDLEWTNLKELIQPLGQAI